MHTLVPVLMLVLTVVIVYGILARAWFVLKQRRGTTLSIRQDDRGHASHQSLLAAFIIAIVASAGILVFKELGNWFGWVLGILFGGAIVYAILMPAWRQYHEV